MKEEKLVVTEKALAEGKARWLADQAKLQKHVSEIMNPQ